MDENSNITTFLPAIVKQKLDLYKNINKDNLIASKPIVEITEALNGFESRDVLQIALNLISTRDSLLKSTLLVKGNSDNNVVSDLESRTEEQIYDKMKEFAEKLKTVNEKLMKEEQVDLNKKEPNSFLKRYEEEQANYAPYYDEDEMEDVGSPISKTRIVYRYL